MESNIKGKTCIVTGASSGIGKALSLKLAEYGGKMILICRNKERGDIVVTEIKEKTNNTDIELIVIDLSSHESIKNGIIGIKEKNNKIDILINNAGVLLFEKELTHENIEKTFATNFLGPFLFTNLLLKLLLQGAPSRIINVVSEGTSNGEIDIENLQNPKKYNPIKAYSESKQAEILFTYELANRLDETGITANCFYPGLVKTNLGKVEKGFRKLTFSIISALLKSKFIPIEESIKLGVFLAISNKVVKTSGRYFKRDQNKIIQINDFNTQLAKKLWEFSASLTGIDENIPNRILK